MKVYLYREKEELNKNNIFHCNVLTGFCLLTLMINKIWFHFVSVPILFQDFNGNRAHMNQIYSISPLFHCFLAAKYCIG